MIGHVTIGHTVWCRLITKFWISQFRIQSRSGPQDGRLGIRLVDNARQGIIAWYLNWIRGFTTRWMKLYVNVITEHKDRTTYWKVAFHRKYLMGKYNSSFKFTLAITVKKVQKRENSKKSRWPSNLTALIVLGQDWYKKSYKTRSSLIKAEQKRLCLPRPLLSPISVEAFTTDMEICLYISLNH